MGFPRGGKRGQRDKKEREGHDDPGFQQAHLKTHILDTEPKISRGQSRLLTAAFFLGGNEACCWPMGNRAKWPELIFQEQNRRKSVIGLCFRDLNHMQKSTSWYQPRGNDGFPTKGRQPHISMLFVLQILWHMGKLNLKRTFLPWFFLSFFAFRK